MVSGALEEVEVTPGYIQQTISALKQENLDPEIEEKLLIVQHLKEKLVQLDTKTPVVPIPSPPPSSPPKKRPAPQPVQLLEPPPPKRSKADKVVVEPE